MTLFDTEPLAHVGCRGCALCVASPSAGSKRTARNKALLERGVHPVTRLALAGDGHTCGDCANHVARSFSKTYHKCRLNETAGPATDIRVSWPACTQWKAGA